MDDSVACVFISVIVGFWGMFLGVSMGKHLMESVALDLRHRIEKLKSELRDKNKALEDALENEIYLRRQIAAVPHDDHYRNCI